MMQKPKAICIIGSPRANGSTAYLVDKIIEGLESGGAEVARYILGDLNINYCRGCEECESSHQCVQTDDMSILLKGIMESDIILLASPSYWGEVTGQMKVFFDRSLPLCNAKTGMTPIPAGKIGVAVAVRAGSSRIENSHIIDSFHHYFGHLGVKPVADIMAESINDVSDIKNNEGRLKEAREIGEKAAGLIRLFP
jgi:multimeric flavodoxin WrbA